MTKIISSLLLITFMLWILPLGYFIKPSQEKVACDGQRAMCMCHALISKSTDKVMEHGLSLKTNPSSNKENSSVGNYFVSKNSIIISNLYSVSIFTNQSLAYQNPYLAAIESVPKNLI